MKFCTRLQAALVVGMLTCSMPTLAASTLQRFEPATLKQIVASQRGQPFVLVLWSLDCVYCQTSLTTLSQASRTPNKLRVITVAIDTLDDSQSAMLIQEKLTTLGLMTDAWAFGAAPAEQLRYAIDPNWHGEMPRSYWFDRAGKMRAHSGVIDEGALQRLTANF